MRISNLLVKKFNFIQLKTFNNVPSFIKSTKSEKQYYLCICNKKETLFAE